MRSTLDNGCLTGWKRGMNDPEVTMLDALPTSNLTAYRKAIEAAGEAIDLVRRVPAPLKSLADQVIRSAASVAANNDASGLVVASVCLRADFGSSPLNNGAQK